MAATSRKRATGRTGKAYIKKGVLVIDLNPYFQRKLGETLAFDGEQEKYLMEVISITETPNVAHLEVSSLPNSDLEDEWTYQGVFEVDLNLVHSVRSVKEAVVVCLKHGANTFIVQKV